MQQKRDREYRDQAHTVWDRSSDNTTETFTGDSIVRAGYEASTSEAGGESDGVFEFNLLQI